MQNYTINNNLMIQAEYYENRKNWGHKARAYYKGREIASTKIVYQNRTWEAYTYQSVMQKLIESKDAIRWIPEADRLEAITKIKTGDDREMRGLRMIGALASVAGIMGGNESKERILGTIPGLDLEPLQGLDEETKSKRLDGVIDILTNTTL